MSGWRLAAWRSPTPLAEGAGAAGRCRGAPQPRRQDPHAATAAGRVFGATDGHAAVYVLSGLRLSGQPPLPHPHTHTGVASASVRALGSSLSVVSRASRHGGTAFSLLSSLPPTATVPPQPALFSSRHVKILSRGSRPQRAKGRPALGLARGPGRPAPPPPPPPTRRVLADRQRHEWGAAALRRRGLGRGGWRGGGEAERESLDVGAAAATYGASHGGLAPPQPPPPTTARTTGGGQSLRHERRRPPAGSSTIRRVSWGGGGVTPLAREQRRVQTVPTSLRK